MRILKNLSAILISGIWISLSEFFRNEILLKNYWINHYNKLGLIFPNTPINGIIWGIWSFLLSIAIFVLLRKFSILFTTFLSWFFAFVLMWLVIGNMEVLPYTILPFAIPLSILECFVATYIIKILKYK